VTTLTIPDPSLVLMIGPAGSGKSTLAARLFAAEEILSSDALRRVVSGDEADQRASAVAFRILHRTLERRLAAGQLTVVDATNTKSEHRRPLVARARAAGVPVVAIVLDLPAGVVHARNAGRAGRVVDRAIVDRHLDAIRRMLDTGRLAAEGILRGVILRTEADVAALRVVRSRSTHPRETAPATTSAAQTATRLTGTDDPPEGPGP
jgi:protein phosphatase